MRYILFPFKVFLYLLWFVPTALLAIFCVAFAPVICLFIDKDGYLPKWLKWFEPVDTIHGCYDLLWAQRSDHAGWSLYRLCWTFIQRNPAYGFESSWVSSKPNKIVTATIFGNLNVQEKDGIAGYFFILAENGTFQLKVVWHIGSQAIIHEAGWQLKNPSLKTFGSYELAPIRLQPFA